MENGIFEQLQFEHLLAHTFPGFFSALTLFMLIDILSPRNLTLWAFNNITGVVGFIGFVVLIGTTLGVVIDGLHHLIETYIFRNTIEFKEISAFLRDLYPPFDQKITFSYFFKEEKFMQIDKYIENEVYRYSEFYVNTFISLLPFSLVAPLYLFNVLQIPWNYSGFPVGILSFILACTMLYCGYVDFKKYYKNIYSAICSYLKCEYYINLSKELLNDGTFELEAKISEKESRISISTNGVKVNFKSMIGKIVPKNNGETDVHGVARATLRIKKSEIAIVTATSEKCIPGITTVKYYGVIQRAYHCLLEHLDCSNFH